MADPVPFWVLNEKLKPKFTAMERLLYSLDLDGNPSPNSSLRRCNRTTPRPTILEPEPQDPEPQDPESQDPEPQDPESQDPETQDPEPQDPESQDPETQDLEPQDPEPQDLDQDQDLVDFSGPAQSLDDLEEVNEDLTTFPEHLNTGDNLLAMVTQCLSLGPASQHLRPSSEGEEGRVSPGPAQDGEGSDGQDPGQAGGVGDGSGDSGGSGTASPLQRNYNDRALPDLIRSGRPLSRRRTLGPVSDTLKEVRREVELSRRRSLRLKAQVDRLQENREGTGDRVTQEVLSVLRLLLPLTGPGPEPSPSEGSSLDSALQQLKTVARKLAVSHAEQGSRCGERNGTGEEDTAVLQQALRDRDDAIEKKKAMEAELLRSKTEMMSLNNQLLDAVQKRLEMSLEMEGWKEDIQLLLRQQLHSQQQQAEQQLAPKKTSRLGLLRRNNKPLPQRPASIAGDLSSSSAAVAAGQVSLSRPVFSIPVSAPAADPGTGRTPGGAPKTPCSSPPAPPTQRTWMDKLRRGRGGRQGNQDQSEQQTVGTGSKGMEGFFNVALD
ncbi:bicaudal-D-related protein 2-like [Aplochiton taeniatus]